MLLIMKKCSVQCGIHMKRGGRVTILCKYVDKNNAVATLQKATTQSPKLKFEILLDFK